MARTKLLEQVVQQQAARIAELEKRLNKNSDNSSMPPSSDGLKKPPRTASLRENGTYNSGGHKGETLKQIESPDVIKKHVLLSCPSCHSSLLSSSVIGLMKRQVFDIPPPKVEVIEHQAEIKYAIKRLQQHFLPVFTHLFNTLRSFVVRVSIINTSILFRKTGCNSCFRLVWNTTCYGNMNWI